MQDYLGNKLEKGDKVVAVVGRHLRKSIIEEITPISGCTSTQGYTIADLKIKGLKTIIGSNDVIKINY